MLLMLASSLLVASVSLPVIVAIGLDVVNAEFNAGDDNIFLSSYPTYNWILSTCITLFLDVISIFIVLSSMFLVWVTMIKKKEKKQSLVESFLEENILFSVTEEQLSDLSKTPVDNIHLVVLVHGYNNTPFDIRWIRRHVEKEVFRVKEEDENLKDKLSNTKFLIHASAANSGTIKTQDGIHAGGTRLAQEINGILKQLVDIKRMQQLKHTCDGSNNEGTISLSLFGYSLGGLYIRYALRDIQRQLDQWNTDMKVDGNNVNNSFPVHVDFNVFCTYACPNFGLSYGNAFLPIPRIVSRILARSNKTARDLYSHSDVVEKLGLDPEFLIPLRRFKKRIAYASAFWHDVMVPTKTAAFLTNKASTKDEQLRDSSASPHYRTNNGYPFPLGGNKNSSSYTLSASNVLIPAYFVVPLTVETPRKENYIFQNENQDNSSRALLQTCSTDSSDCTSTSSYGEGSRDTEDSDDTFVENSDRCSPEDSKVDQNYKCCDYLHDDGATLEERIASNLDSMGWTKVFVDLRSRVPSIKLPWALKDTDSPLFSFHLPDSYNKFDNNSNADNPQKDKKEWESVDLCNEICKFYDRWYIPLGHTIMAANCKSLATAHLNPEGHFLLRKVAYDVIQSAIVEEVEEKKIK